MNETCAYMLAEAMYKGGHRSPLGREFTKEFYSLTDEEYDMIERHFTNVERMAQVVETKDSWWRSAKMTYIVFGRTSDSIDGAVAVYERLCGADRLDVVEDAMAVTGAYMEAVASRTGIAETALERVLRKCIHDEDLAERLVSTGTGGELLAVALEGLESKARGEAACQSRGSIAVMPEDYFVADAARSRDVVKAVLKITTDINRELDEEAACEDIDDGCPLSLIAKDGISEFKRKFFAWLATPCPGDYRGQD